MSGIDVARIRHDLLRRGTELSGSYKGDPAEAVKSLGLTPDPAIMEVYRAFDGFPEGVVDGASCVRLWTWSEIVDGINKDNPSSIAAFADLLMGSQDIIFDISNASHPIVYGDTKEIIAKDLLEFLNGLSSGKLDFQ